MRVDAETRAFFETLMSKEPPPEQEFLRLLIEDQLKTLISVLYSRAGSLALRDDAEVR